MPRLTFVTASHNPAVLAENLLKSAAIDGQPIIIQTRYDNIPAAYNAAKLPLGTTLVCYVHHDVFLPINFLPQLNYYLNLLPDDWDVLGVAGVTGPPKQNYGYILDRGKNWGAMRKTPVKVDTLDELLLITRGNIKFDETFAQDFYGADICMGRNAYVVPCFVHHNSTREFGGRTEAFYKAEAAFKEKHKDKLPIVTTCSNLLPDAP